MNGNTEIKLDKSEVLRYMGHRGRNVSPSIESIVEECMEEIVRLSRYRYVYKIVDVKIGFYKGESCIELEGANVRLTGNDIYEHLRGCKKCALMAATLGIEVDSAIRVAQSADMLKALALDACAADMIEKVCDIAESEIRLKAEAENCGINFRFSPGYGDLPMSAQKSVLGALDAGRKIGLTLTDTSLMIPGKSVTAIVGFTREYKKPKLKSGCEICSMRDSCKLRKAGTNCGHN